MPGEIRVLVVDDSPTAREIISRILNSEQGIRVVGEAKNGQEAIGLNDSLRPDIITMDVEMPVMDGITAVEEIMAYKPTPILMVTNLLPKRVNLAFEAMSVGALDTMAKPNLEDLGSGELNNPSRQLIEKVKLLAGVKVVTHLSGRLKKQREAIRHVGDLTLAMTSSFKLVAIGASTGGPKALHAILKSLPEDFPLPIGIVQHISDGFTQGLVDWLDYTCKLKVIMAASGNQLQPGQVAIAPSRVHMKVSARGTIELEDSPPVLNQKPSVDVFFSSVAKTYARQAIGVILTGMGEDGAYGLKEMYDAGAYTIAQNEEDCVIFGMPKVAIDLGGVKKIMPLDKIADELMALTQR